MSELFKQAIAAAQEGHYHQAIDSFTRVIAEAYAWRSHVYLKLQDKEAALKDANTSIEIMPTSLAYEVRGIFSLHQNRNEMQKAAIDDLTQAIAMNPEKASLYYERGKVYAMDELYYSASKDYETAIKLGMTDWECYRDRGVAYHENEDYREAIADFNHCLKLYPDNADLYSKRATTYEAAERIEAALKDFSKCIELEPENLEHWSNRANCYYNNERYAEAIIDLRAAKAINERDLDPDEYFDEELTEMLEQVQEAFEESLRGDDDDDDHDVVDDGTAQILFNAEMTTAPKELESLLDQLDRLTGLPQVKAEVKGLINLVRVQQLRQERGLTTLPMSLHLIFTGNPGTGKTTVARLISQIYQSLGLLSKGHLVEVDRAGLVAGYVGQTALKTAEVIRRARGGVLFIDEAYALTTNKGENDFGKEAIDTLIKGMEDHRSDFIVIGAGYSEPMQKFLQSNPGLQSRFSKYIYFEDYPLSELLGILKNLSEQAGYRLSKSALKQAQSMIEALNRQHADKFGSVFGNARGVRNLMEQAIAAQANRIIHLGQPSDEELSTLEAEDFKVKCLAS